MDTAIIAAFITAVAMITAALLRFLPRKVHHKKTGREINPPGTQAEINLPAATYPCYSAPASIFIAGEHAVMFGHAALYLPLPKRLRVTVEPDPRSTGVTFADFLIADPENPENRKRIEDCAHYHREISQAEELKLNGLFREVILPFVPKTQAGEPQGFRLHVDSDFPVACGLDSSGAIAACLAKALADNFMDVDLFCAKTGIDGCNKERTTLLLAWMIENCFHNSRGSGAGVTAAIRGRVGRHPLVYFPSRRSLLVHRMQNGWSPVAVGEGLNALRELAALKTFIFDPSVGTSGIPAYDPPPQYHVSLLYSGNPSKTGEILAEPPRQFNPRHGGRVAAIQEELRRTIDFDRLNRSVNVHAAEIIDKIYLNSELPEKQRDEQLRSSYHELLCEGLGSLSILMMNSVLWDWARVPDLMNAYQASLNVAGVSNLKIQSIAARVSQEALDRRFSASVGCKITGCGRGGDVVVFSLNTSPSKHDELVRAVSQKEIAPIHFQSTEHSKDAWEQVQGVRKEA